MNKGEEIWSHQSGTHQVCFPACRAKQKRMRADNKGGPQDLDARKKESHVVKEQEALGQCNRLTRQELCQM